MFSVTIPTQTVVTPDLMKSVSFFPNPKKLFFFYFSSVICSLSTICVDLLFSLLFFIMFL